MSESFDHTDAQLAIDDALADIERACRELKDDDETTQMENGIQSMSQCIMNSAKELALTKFRLNSLEEIYRDAIQSIQEDGDKCTGQIRQRLIELDGQINSTINDSTTTSDAYDMNVDDDAEDMASQPSTSTGRGAGRGSRPSTQSKKKQGTAHEFTSLIDQIKKSIPKGSQVMNNLKSERDEQIVEPTEFLSLNSLKNILQIQRKKSKGNRASNQSNDLEVLEDESENVLIDPISKKPIEHPVRNKRCKHIYDKSSILKFISSSSNPRCPNIGCANKTLLTRAAIEDVSLDEM